MFKVFKDYFSEFAVLKQATREFWIVQFSIFADSLAYFAMTTILTMYFTTTIGFNDEQSGAIVGVWTLMITISIFVAGFVSDYIGIKKSFLIAIGILAASRFFMGVAPLMFDGDILKYSTVGVIMLASFGSALVVPVNMTAMKRYTNKETRSVAFNMYYVIMNLGGVLAGYLIWGTREIVGEVNSYMAIFDVAAVIYIFAFAAMLFLRGDNYQDLDEETEEEKAKAVERAATKRSFLQMVREVFSESLFWKFILFVTLTTGAKLGFANMFLLMPKYYMRVMTTDVSYGILNSMNPAIIVVGLIIATPIIKKFNVVTLIVVGTIVSAISMLPMALPLDVLIQIPGITSYDDAYWFVIVLQIVIFSLGEIIWSPRLMEYTALIAPKEKIGSYMSLAALPQFIAKPLNGFLSGYLLMHYCYDGVKAKIETGSLSYTESPEIMWIFYFLIALSTPISILLLRKFLTSGTHVDDDINEKPETA